MAKQNTEPEIKLDLGDGIMPAKDVHAQVKLETTLLENKYFKWIISFGIAFIVLKMIDTGSEVMYIKGQQESYDKTINTLFDTRDKQLEELQKENSSLEDKLLEFEKLKFEMEKLKFENLKLVEKIKKEK